MARLHEHQGKALLAGRGVAIPRGRVVDNAPDAVHVAEEIAGPVAIKIQAWTTGRAAMGGVAFADTPGSAKKAAKRLLSMNVGAFPVEQVLVEEALPIKDELFLSLNIDDAARAPVLLLSLAGGSGVEERADQVHRLGVDVQTGVDRAEVLRLLSESPIDAVHHDPIADAVDAVAQLAREVEARSIEINPLVTTADGRVVAADCRMTIDDYAVFRHGELGVEIARELDHPPTELEKIAYRIEQADHRGTFFFARLPVEDDQRPIGFHGAGGGGSMMSMDAVTQAGFTPANFTDTSGNPSPAKVYAAARVILAQEGLLGYFGSGSGVASQEQHHSAYGLAKAFCELNLDIPALIRLGGNSEDRAVRILDNAALGLPAAVEGYKKDDTPAFIADRFGRLVDDAGGAAWKPRARQAPAFVGSASAMSFPLRLGQGWTGRAWINVDACSRSATQILVNFGAGVFRNHNDKPALAVSLEEAAAKDSELIACEIECIIAGLPVVFVDIPIPGLDDASAPASGRTGASGTNVGGTGAGGTGASPVNENEKTR